MNFSNVYNSIIENAKCQQRTKSQGTYYESHHIVPKSLGDSDTPDNLVLLTAKEHFVAHHLLTKIHPDSSKLLLAYFGMCKWKSSTNNRNYTVTSRTYEKIKNELYGTNGKLIGEKHFSHGRKHTEEAKKKMSNSVKESYRKGTRKKHNRSIPHTEETKKKMSIAKKGKYMGADNSFSKKCSINGKVYGSASEVLNDFNITYRTVLNRIKSDKFEDWFYL
jgi:hypothetical protein